MVWQDVVISIGQWIFVVALLPSVFGKDKPALSTSLITGAVLAAFAVTFATLLFWNSAISAAILSLTWFVLAVQKHPLEKNKKAG